MAQKASKNLQKTPVENQASQQPQEGASTGNAQGAPMAVTLGAAQAAAQQQRQGGGGRTPTSDVPMNEAGSSAGDPLTTAARNDGPRQSITQQVDMAQVVEATEVNGEVPQARFGHTITIVSKQKVVLFGGATGDTGKYSMTGETFMYNILSKTWQKLSVKGVPPSPRAAHSSTNVEQMQMVVYGGATGGGSLASDDLYLLDMRNGEDMAQWMIVPVVGSTPGRRYGHSIIFSKPHLLVFGGNTGAEPVNDVWCLSVERAPFSWTKLDCGREQPASRVYHSAALCQTGSATGMMVCFGGRTTDQSSLSDTWGLRRHRDGRWDWVKAPYKSGEAPTPRYQHSTLFLGPLMMVIGGRTNQVGEDVALEVYDTESSEWYKFRAIQRFRTAVWSIDTSVFKSFEICNNVYVHGGFEHETPNIPINTISRIDATKLFTHHPALAAKILPKNSKSGKETGPKSNIRKNQNIYNMIENQEFRLANQAHIAMSLNQNGQQQQEAPAEDFSLMVRQISIDKLQEEPRKLGPNVKAPLIQKNHNESLYAIFIKDLLQPRDGQAAIQAMRPFHIKKEQILELINEVSQVFMAQPMLIKNLRPPTKIFGNIHGNYNDLMRFFDIWKAPTEAGDISDFDYIFLGNYPILPIDFI